MGARLQATEEDMMCVVCRQAETEMGQATVVLERGGLTMVVKQVPARVCPNCGEEYVDEAVARLVLRRAEEVARHGTLVEITQYTAA
jgi:YgiT-type zinc finger domain-containing protein